MIVGKQMIGGSPHGIRVKVLDYDIEGKRVRIPVMLFSPLSDDYPWERYETPYLLGYGLDNGTNVPQHG